METILASKREFVASKRKSVSPVSAAAAASGDAAPSLAEAASTLDDDWSANCSSAPGDGFTLTSTQRIVRALLAPGRSPYRGLILFHATGTGKTCTAVTVAEAHARELDSPVVVICRPSLAQGFRDTIYNDRLGANQCTRWGRELPEKATAHIRKTYTFVGPIEFANRLSQITDDRRLRLAYDRSVVIVDEAHNLRSSASQTLSALRRLVSTCSDIRLILMTATPMFNLSTDVLVLVNLLRMNDRRPVVDRASIFSESGMLVDADALAEAARGYVSYVGGGDPATFPRRLTPVEVGNVPLLSSAPSRDLLGQPIDAGRRLSQHVRGMIAASPLSPEGSGAVYQRLSRDLDSETLNQSIPQLIEEGDDVQAQAQAPDAAATSGITTLSSLMHASNITYGACDEGCSPSSVLGQAGFRRIFRMTAGGYAYNNPAAPPLLASPQLGAWSPKIETILSIAERSEGVVMIYSRYIYSGILPLAIALEHRGYLPALDAPPLLSDARRRPPSSLRYTIISGQTNLTTDLARTLKELQSIKNIDGAVIKVVLISDRGSEGLNLRFVREVHVLEPWFHLNKIEQIIGRAARYCSSHAELPLGRRNFTLYLHAIEKGDVETIDLFTYRLADRKQTDIDAATAVLMDAAVDCMIHETADPSAIERARFYGKSKIKIVTSQGTDLVVPVLLPDPPNRKRMGCRWKGADAQPVGADDSTYDVFFHADEELENTRGAIRQLFETGSVGPRATPDELWGALTTTAPPKGGSVVGRDVFDAALKMIIDLGERVYLGGRRAGSLVVCPGSRRVCFHPLDESIRGLTDLERSADPPTTELQAIAAAAAMQPPSSRQGDADTTTTHLVRLAKAAKLFLDVVEEVFPGRSPEFAVAAIDAVLDRMDPAALRDLGDEVARSGNRDGVVSSRVAVALGDEAERVELPSASVTCNRSRNHRCDFRIIADTGMASKRGTICHDTSIITTRDLAKRVVDALGEDASVVDLILERSGRRPTKMTLCICYELVLRMRGLVRRPNIASKRRSGLSIKRTSEARPTRGRPGESAAAAAEEDPKNPRASR